MKKTNRKSLITSSLIAGLSVTLLTGAKTALVDPTRPPDALIEPTKTINIKGPMTLSAIFIYPGHQIAIINGKTVQPGDELGEYTIININRDTVELSGSEGKTLTLSLVPTVKQAVNNEER